MADNQKDVQFLDVEHTTLDEWLEWLHVPPAGKVFNANHFPTDKHREAFFERLPDMPHRDVMVVLRSFIVRTGSTPIDMIYASVVARRVKNGDLKLEEIQEHDRRLLQHLVSKGKYPAWEGLHWVLDLLPHYPRKALAALDAFFIARCQDLNDSYLVGHGEAATIIRHRFIESPGTVVNASNTLSKLDWREMEWLAGALYEEMGYKVEVTPRSDDDGIDVLATREERGDPARVTIQVKKWSDSHHVEKADVRELLGTMDLARATSGVLITTGRFTRGAKELMERDPRVDPIDRAEFIKLLNEHCGTDWYLRADQLISSLKIKRVS